MPYIDSCTAKTAREVLAPQTEFIPYRGLKTAHQMRLFCKAISDTQANVRAGRWDAALYEWLHPHWHESDFDQLSACERGGQAACDAFLKGRGL